MHQRNRTPIAITVRPPNMGLMPLIEYKYINDEVIVKEKKQLAKKFSTAEFNTLFGISKTHGIFYKAKHQLIVEALIKKLKSQTIIDSQLVQSYLNNPKHYFRVEYINSTIGYGLVANEDIPRHTVVGIYSGEMIIQSSNESENISTQERMYDMSVYSGIILNGGKYHISLRATNGDITRFAHHAYTKSELSQQTLDRTINPSAVLTANMNFPLAIINGKPIRYFVTTTAIKKDDYGTISYGTGYWKSRGQPSLFVREQNGYKIANYTSSLSKYMLSNELITNPIPLEQKQVQSITPQKNTSSQNIKKKKFTVVSNHHFFAANLRQYPPAKPRVFAPLPHIRTRK